VDGEQVERAALPAEQAALLAEKVHRAQMALVEMSRRVAETEERLAANFERLAELSPGRAEELLDKAAFVRQFAQIERWRSAQHARNVSR